MFYFMPCSENSYRVIKFEKIIMKKFLEIRRVSKQEKNTKKIQGRKFVEAYILMGVHI